MSSGCLNEVFLVSDFVLSMEVSLLGELTRGGICLGELTLGGICLDLEAAEESTLTRDGVEGFLPGRGSSCPDFFVKLLI